MKENCCKWKQRYCPDPPFAAHNGFAWSIRQIWNFKIKAVHKIKIIKTYQKKLLFKFYFFKSLKNLSLKEEEKNLQLSFYSIL